MPDDATKPSQPTLAELLEEAGQRRGRRRAAPSKAADAGTSGSAFELIDREPAGPKAEPEVEPAGPGSAGARPTVTEVASGLEEQIGRGHDRASRGQGGQGGPGTASGQRNAPAAGLAPLALLQFGNGRRGQTAAKTAMAATSPPALDPPAPDSPALDPAGRPPRDDVAPRREATGKHDQPDRPDLRGPDSRARVALRGQPADRNDRQARSKVARRDARERALQRPTLEATAINFPPLPMPSRRKSRGELLSFLLVVALPVCVAIGYYFFIASNQYVSEFKFVVRDALSASSGSKDSGMGDVMAMAGGSRANSLESYMVTEFVKSQKAVEEVQARIDVRKLYSRPDIDWFGRFDEERPIEEFTAYWDQKVSAQFDMLTGIGTARVRAYRPEDALLIATTVLSMSEELINNVATRPQRDAVRSAEADLKKAEGRLVELTTKLALFRNTEQVIDPTSNVVASNAQLAQQLRGQLAQYQTELSSLKQQHLDANAPMSRVLQSRIKATREQLASVEAEVGRSRDGASPLSKVMGEYERIDLERQFAQDSVKAAMKTLDEARSSAVFQHMYVTPFVSPGLPQSSTFPKRLSSIAIVAFVCLLAWTAGLLFVRSVREHLS